MLKLDSPAFQKYGYTSGTVSSSPDPVLAITILEAFVEELFEYHVTLTRMNTMRSPGVTPLFRYESFMRHQSFKYFFFFSDFGDWNNLLAFKVA